MAQARAQCMRWTPGGCLGHLTHIFFGSVQICMYSASVTAPWPLAGLGAILQLQTIILGSGYSGSYLTVVYLVSLIVCYRAGVIILHEPVIPKHLMPSQLQKRLQLSITPVVSLVVANGDHVSI